MWSSEIVPASHARIKRRGSGRLAAALPTFGDYLVFHPHLHSLYADSLFDPRGRFHGTPMEDLTALTELFRARFLLAVHRAKLIPRK